MKKTICLMLLVATSAFADGGDLQKEKQLSAAYLAKMAAESGARVIEQGIVLKPIFSNQQGANPSASDQVTVAYLLTDRTGKVLDQTGDDTATFGLTGLIECWQIAIPKMTVGSIFKVSCPSDTAYGDQGAGNGLIAGGAVLTFRITVLETTH